MPLKNQLHVDTLLSNISVKYANTEYIADKVFPQLPVMKDSDKYRIWVRNFRLPESLRNHKGVAREHDFDVTTSSYLLADHALKNYVSDDDADNYDISDLRADTTEELTDKIMLRMEKSVADLFTTTNWSLNVSLAAANAFSANTTVSNPIPIFDTAATTIIQNSGYQPNFGILPRNGFINCKNHVSVLDRVKYVSKDMTVDMLAALFNLPSLLVPIASIDNAALGVAESIGNVWGDNAFVGYKAPTPSPLKPSAGYIFVKNQPRVRRWRDEERKSEAIEVQMKFQPKVVASLTGYLIRDID
jgi:hypothetical protein